MHSQARDAELRAVFWLLRWLKDQTPQAGCAASSIAAHPLRRAAEDKCRCHAALPIERDGSHLRARLCGTAVPAQHPCVGWHGRGPGGGTGSLPEGPALSFPCLWLQKNFLQPFQVAHLETLPFPASANVPVCLRTLRRCRLGMRFNSDFPRKAGGLPGTCTRCEAGMLPPAFGHLSRKRAFVRPHQAMRQEFRIS